MAVTRRRLPGEILDLILDALFQFKYTSKPDGFCSHCERWQAQPDPLPFQLRLVCRSFRDYLDPVLFHLLVQKGSQSLQRLHGLADSKIAKHIHTLRMEVNPRELFSPHATGDSTAKGYRRIRRPPDEGDYFLKLESALVPLLSRFCNVRVLFLTMRHDDTTIASTSQGLLLLPYFQTLCIIIRDACLEYLEELQIGVPYEGGYGQEFFRDKRLKDAVFSIGDENRFNRVTIKLSDRMENYTIMPIL